MLKGKSTNGGALASRIGFQQVATAALSAEDAAATLEQRAIEGGSALSAPMEISREKRPTWLPAVISIYGLFPTDRHWWGGQNRERLWGILGKNARSELERR